MTTDEEFLKLAREFVIAYMKQCDVPCGMKGAEVLLGKINQTVADLRSNALGKPTAANELNEG